MTTITNTYNLTSIKQLIDLNGDNVNFELQFKIDAKNGDTFDALVVTQEIIDSGSELNYQKAEGSIGGNIISDKGQYQNYLLLLKADKPTEVNVTIQIKELPPPQQVPPQQVPPHQVPPQEQFYQPPYNPYQHQQPITQKPAKSKKINWLNIIFIVIGVVLAGIVGWMLYKYYTKPDPQVVLESQFNQEIDTSKITDEISKIVDGKISEMDSKLDNKFSALESGINVSSNKFGENFSSLHEQFKNIDVKVNEAISQNTGIVDKVVGKVIDNNKGLFNEVIEKNSGMLTEAMEKNTGIFNQAMEKHSILVSEAVETTLNKTSKLDLSGVQSQLSDISSKLERDTGSQISNPLSLKPSKKESLSSQIKNLKISST